MSIWTELVLYSVNTPAAGSLLHVCKHFGAASVPYIEVIPHEFHDEDDPLEIATGLSVQEAFKELYQQKSFYRASVPLQCSGYLHDLNKELKDVDGGMDYSFLGIAIEIGEHEFGGFSAQADPGSEEVGLSASFSLSIGGDDPKAEFREVWQAIQKTESYVELLEVLENHIGSVQVKMIMST